MNFSFAHPTISILIPFFGEDNVLSCCLESCATQNYSNIEIIVVNDNGDEKTCSASKIIDDFVLKYKKRKGITVRYFEHKENEGTFETRRTCIEQCQGKYCVFVDSDDTLLPDALECLFEKATEIKADIVQGMAQVLFDENVPQDKITSTQKKGKNVHLGLIEGASSIIDDFLCNKGHSSFLWGKLFLTSSVRKAYSQIPAFYGAMGEDFLLYYFICLNSSTYFGIDRYVYQYDIRNGLTSYTPISDIEKWRKVCSVSSIFTVLYAFFEDNPPPEKHKAAIQNACLSYLANNLKQLDISVVPELKKEAYSLLCEYWGESFVEKIRKAVAL